jgi:SAM-dependent methyltransferase
VDDSWDPVWEEIFKTRAWGQYPPEELIRFTANHFHKVPNRSDVRILEIGCGTGANIWYLAREGFSVYGLDGSRSAILKANEKLKNERLVANLLEGDIIHSSQLYPSVSFDAVIDVACIQHNRLMDAGGTIKINIILDQIVTLLKPSGRFFGMLVAEGSWGDGLGEEVEAGTFVNISEGPYQGMGVTHFFSQNEISRFFGERFADLKVEYALRSYSNQEKVVKHWIVQGTKRK